MLDDHQDHEPQGHQLFDDDVQRTENECIGDPLLLDKPPGTTRIYMQNVNGFHLGPASTYCAAMEHLRDMEVDHAMFCEHKLDTTKPKVTPLMYQHSQRVFGLGAFRLKAASSQIPYESNYKPGGTMSVSVGHITGRIKEQGRDPLG